MLAAILAASTGAVIGSFLDCLAARWGNVDRTFLLGRSRCIACGTTLAARDLVPIVSYLRNRGRCRYCSARIGPLPLVAEIVAASMAAISASLLAPPSAFLLAMVGWALLLLALIDLRHGILPDILTLPLAAAGALVAWLGAFDALPDGTASLAGAALGFLLFAGLGRLYEWWRGRPGLGLGDAKLLAAAGAWLGIAALPYVILLAATAGLLAAFSSGRWRATDQLAFGPWLALAFWLILAWTLRAG